MEIDGNELQSEKIVPISIPTRNIFTSKPFIITVSVVVIVLLAILFIFTMYIVVSQNRLSARSKSQIVVSSTVKPTNVDTIISNSAQLSLSKLLFTSVGPTQLLVSDELGRRVGYDAINSKKVIEIPGSSYDYEDPIGDPSGGHLPPLPGSGTYTVRVELPKAGKYNVKVVAPIGTDYTFAIYAYDKQDSLALYGFEGKHESSSEEYQLVYNPVSGTVPLTRFISIINKPRSNNNTFRASVESIPIALIKDGTFDPAKLSDIHFGPGRALPSGQDDWADVDSDGDLDRIIHFSVSEAALDQSQACLTGTIPGSLPITGCYSLTSP